MKKILYFLIIILIILSLLILDYLNIITKLGLSVSFWSGLLVGIFPIFLTIFLWKKEEKDRIAQIKEETEFQKRLVVRSQYIDYFESLLEQIRLLSIFIKSFVIVRDEQSVVEKAQALIKTCYLYDDNKIWNIEYRMFPFKAIDIYIFKYNYNGIEVNLRGYLPYLEFSNGLNAITKGEELCFPYLKKLSEKDKFMKAKEIIDNKKSINELYNFLQYLMEDIENKLV